MAAKEKLDTLGMWDALRAGEECLFCWMERRLEKEALEFVLGSSYMESQVREETSRQGFCRRHTKMMYDYGNTLGNAWILKSRMERINREFARQAEAGRSQEVPEGFAATTEKPGQAGRFLGRMALRIPRSQRSGRGKSETGEWLQRELSDCYLCRRVQAGYERMMNTFFYLLLHDAEFGNVLMDSKGMCLFHFSEVTAAGSQKCTPGEWGVWAPRLEELMLRNLKRIQDDIDWLIEKYDYRNQEADWKQSRDAVQRTMQKLTGGYPADPVFRRKA